MSVLLCGEDSLGTVRSRQDGAVSAHFSRGSVLKLGIHGEFVKLLQISYSYLSFDCLTILDCLKQLYLIS